MTPADARAYLYSQIATRTGLEHIRAAGYGHLPIDLDRATDEDVMLAAAAVQWTQPDDPHDGQVDAYHDHLWLVR